MPRREGPVAAALEHEALGATDGDLVMVRGSVTVDDQVISDNLQKIGPGAPVQPLPPQTASQQAPQ